MDKPFSVRDFARPEPEVSPAMEPRQEPDGSVSTPLRSAAARGLFGGLLAAGCLFWLALLALIIPPLGLLLFLALPLCPLLGLALKQGACPVCRTTVYAWCSQGVRCRGCQRALVIREGRLYHFP